MKFIFTNQTIYINESKSKNYYLLTLNDSSLSGDIKYCDLNIIHKFNEVDEIFNKYMKYNRKTNKAIEYHKLYIRKNTEYVKELYNYFKKIFIKNNLKFDKYNLYYYKGNLIMSLLSEDKKDLLKIIHYYGLETNLIKQVNTNSIEIAPNVYYGIQYFKDIKDLLNE